MTIVYQKIKPVEQITCNLILQELEKSVYFSYIFQDNKTLVIALEKHRGKAKVYFSHYVNIGHNGVDIIGVQEFNISDKDKVIKVFLKRLNSKYPEKKVFPWWW